MIPCPLACSTTANSNLSIASAAIATGGTSFSFDASNACPHGSAGSLAGNVSCSYTFDFAPASVGSIPGSLLLTDNNLNVAGATQSISLHGTGITSIVLTLPASATLAAGAVGAAYTPVAFQASGGATPYHYTISAGALPAGLSLSSAGMLTGTPTAGGIFSITVLATGRQLGNCLADLLAHHPPAHHHVLPSAAVLPAASLDSPYTQSFTAAGGSSPYIYSLIGTLPTGLSLSPAGVLSGTPTTNSGPYTFTVTATDSSTGTGPYSGISTTYSLTVGKPTATVTLSNLAQTYTGSPLSATANTLPGGLSVSLTYNGSATPPTAPGSYTVVATITNANYQGSATATLVIAKAMATVTLSNLTQTYTGSPLFATATTVPAGLHVNLTYNGSASGPTAGGSYAVVATIVDSDYAGSTTGAMTIAPLTPTVHLSSSSNPAVVQTAVMFTVSVNSPVGTPTGHGEFPGRHNFDRPGHALRRRSDADHGFLKRWLPLDHRRL